MIKSALKIITSIIVIQWISSTSVLELKTKTKIILKVTTLLTKIIRRFNQTCKNIKQLNWINNIEKLTAFLSCFMHFFCSVVNTKGGGLLEFETSQDVSSAFNLLNFKSHLRFCESKSITGDGCNLIDGRGKFHKI